MAFITEATRKDAIALVVTTLGTAPSAELLADITEKLVGGATMGDIAAHLTSSAAYLAKYPAGQTAEEVASDILDAALVGATVSAEARAEAMDVLTSGLTSGAYTIASATNAVADYLSGPAPAAAFADAAAAFQNRVDAAEDFTKTFTLEGVAVTEAELAAALDGVTSDADTLASAKTAFAAGSKSIAEQAVVDAAAEKAAAEKAAADKAAEEKAAAEKAAEEKAAADKAAEEKAAADAEKALETAATEAATAAATAIEAAEAADAELATAKAASEAAAATAAETDADALATALETATAADTAAKEALETATEAYDDAVAAGDAAAVVTAQGEKIIAEDEAEKAAAALVEATEASEAATAADEAAATAATAYETALEAANEAGEAAETAAAAAVTAAAATADTDDDTAAAAQVTEAAAATDTANEIAEAAADKAAADAEKALEDAVTTAKTAAETAVADSATANTAAANAIDAIDSNVTSAAALTAANAAKTAATAATTAVAAYVAAAAKTADADDDTAAETLSETATTQATAADGYVSTATTEAAIDRVTLSVSSPSVTEGDATTKTLTYTLTLGESHSEAVSINYATNETGTATGNDDFNVAAGVVEFAAGQTVATVSVTVNSDTDFESDETVGITFSGTGLAADVTATGTITNDDTNPDRVETAFTLTTSSDPVTGGAGDDTVIGVIGTNALTASGTTIQAGDALNLGAGSDTLAVSIAGTHTGATNTTTVSLTGIEKIQVSNYETSTNLDTIDLSLATGLETVSLYGSIANGDVAFTGAQNILASEMWNGAGDLSVTYAAAAVAGKADVASLTLSGATAGTFTSAGVETLNVVSAGTNGLTSIASAYKAVNISGGKLTLGNLGTTATVAVDASEQTGKLTATLAGTGNLAVKLGSGGSAIDATADTMTKDDVITGGAGADTLTTDTASLTNALLVGVTGVETLDYDEASSITLTKPTDFTTFDFDAAGDQELVLGTGFTGAVTVDITGDDDTNADVITNTANAAVTVKGNAADFDATTDINGSATATETLIIKADNGTAAITGAGAIDAVDVITIADGTTAGTDVTIDVNAYGTALTIDATALDAGTTASSADNEVLTISNVSRKALTVKGGEGPDVIQDSASADTIEGNGGADVITADQGGADTIKGGAGNDIINMGATLTAADTIDGGDGKDTLNVTSLTAAALAGVTNIETLGYTAAGALSLAADLSFDAISLEGTNNTVLTFATGYKKAMTVSVEEGDSVINTAKIALTVNADDDEINAADNTILTGSATAVDTLNVLNKTGGQTVDMQTDITNFDVVNILDFATTAGNDITVDVTGHGAATGTLTIDASALDDGTGAAAEILTMTGAATASLRVTGGAAGDTIVLGTGKDIIDAGAGKDTITAGANQTYEDTIDGGDGIDTIAATAAVDIDFQNTSNVEVLSATTSAVLANFAQLAGINTVALVGAATLNASGMTSGVTVMAPAATTNAAGSLGDDTFVFQATETLTAADTINGVSGYDTIRLDNDDDADKAGDAVSATLDASVTNIDRVLANDIASTDTAGDVTVILDTTFAQKALEIDGSALDLGEVLTVTAGNNAATEVLTVKGGAGADIIVTGAAKDVIDGGSAADTITAGAGADTITGGAGADNFVYTVTTSNVTTDSISTAKDTITDFTDKSDNLNITVSLADGVQTVDYNDKGDAASVADGLSLLGGVKGQYFFDTTNSQVVFDLDGNGLIQSSDLMISLTGATGITESDVNITLNGGTGDDTITTGDGNDVIDAGAGDDSINAGGGSDKFVQANGDSTAPSAKTTADGANFAAAHTLTFENGVDTITGFTAATDSIDVTTAGAAVTAIGVAENSLTATKTLFLSGAFDTGTGVFTIAADGTGADTLIFDTVDTAIMANDTAIVLIGVDSDDLGAANFI